MKNISVSKGLQKKLPNRIVLYADKGWGKTSFAAYAKEPVFQMTVGETGLITLMQYQQLPDVAYLNNGDKPDFDTWGGSLSAIKWLINEEHNFSTFVVDQLGGQELLCHKYTCQTDFSGKWSDSQYGFMAFHKGFDVALQHWREYLNLLDKLRTEKNMTIILLCHLGIGKVPNPEGETFTKYAPDLHPKTWALTSGWADMILFGRYLTEVKEGKDKKQKAKGGKQRVIHTVNDACWDAKHRHGLPDEILVSNESAQQAWLDFIGSFPKLEAK